MLLHGEAGVGKSWLIGSSPAPRLVLDGEGRAQYLPSQFPKKLWDPRHEHPPPYDGTWDTCIAQVADFDTLDLVYRWLQSGQHHFVSVGVDSLMEAQKRLVDDVAGLDQLDQQDWGEVLRKLEKHMRDYRDLVTKPSNPVRCVVFSVGSKQDNSGKFRPMLQGQIATRSPYMVDVVGYLYVTRDQSGQLTRNLLVEPGHPAALAKDNTDRLPRPVVPSPNLTQIFELLNGHESSEAPEQPVVSPAAVTEGGA